MTQFSYRGRSGKGLINLIVALVLIVILIAFLLPTTHRDRVNSNRVKCASNMRQIGQAILLYANDNKGAYPRTTASEGEEVGPVWGTGAEAKNPFAADGPKPNDVTAAVFLLLRTQDITPEVFTCPDTNAERWDFGGGQKTALDWSNFPKDSVLKYLSYSFANPYPDDAARKSGYALNVYLSAEFAVAADMNPGVITGKTDVLSVSSTSSAKDMKKGNSLNHDSDGQNVLYGDGHVEFNQNPFMGVNRDNIYARKAGSTGFASAPLPLARSPFDKDDSVLLPHTE